MKDKISVDSIKSRKVGKEEKENNLKTSKILAIVVYIIPLIFSVIFAILYTIKLQNKWFLMGFVISGFLTIFGWDGSDRKCPNCNKWNAMIWTSSKIVYKTEEKEKTNLSGKVKKKLKKRKYQEVAGKCKNCGYKHTIVREKMKWF